MGSLLINGADFKGILEYVPSSALGNKCYFFQMLESRASSIITSSNKVLSAAAGYFSYSSITQSNRFKVNSIFYEPALKGTRPFPTRFIGAGTSGYDLAPNSKTYFFLQTINGIDEIHKFSSLPSSKSTAGTVIGEYKCIFADIQAGGGGGCGANGSTNGGGGGSGANAFAAFKFMSDYGICITAGGTNGAGTAGGTGTRPQAGSGTSLTVNVVNRSGTVMGNGSISLNGGTGASCPGGGGGGSASSTNAAISASYGLYVYAIQSGVSGGNGANKGSDHSKMNFSSAVNPENTSRYNFGDSFTGGSSIGSSGGGGGASIHANGGKGGTAGAGTAGTFGSGGGGGSLFIFDGDDGANGSGAKLWLFY